VNVKCFCGSAEAFNVPVPSQCSSGWVGVQCDICGYYKFDSSLYGENLEQWFSNDMSREYSKWVYSDEKENIKRRVALLKHEVRKRALAFAENNRKLFKKHGDAAIGMVVDKNCFVVTKSLIEEIKTKPFPTPMEQIDLLIMFLGDELKTPGTTISYNDKKIEISTASIDDNNKVWILATSKEKDLTMNRQPNVVELTISGWQKYEELKKVKNNSKTAFMAMQFNNEKLQTFYENHIKKAVREEGFFIEKVDENFEKDDNINVDIMLKIRNSRFMICDLSDGNCGAYWEAGYAKGLGKKVIYIYNESQWKKLEQASAEDKKLEQASAEDKKLEQASVEDKKLEQASAENKKLEQASVEDKKLEQASAEDKKLEQASAENKKLEQASAEDKKLEQASAEDEKNQIHKPHFDVDRFRFLFWNEKNPEQFEKQLKDKIQLLTT
jgi:uncharacterized protein YjbI with pentapeptide repeats